MVAEREGHNREIVCHISLCFFDGRMIQGNLTSRTAQRLSREWASQHREELEHNWYKAREGKTLDRIVPLG